MAPSTTRRERIAATSWGRWLPALVLFLAAGALIAAFLIDFLEPGWNGERLERIMGDFVVPLVIAGLVIMLVVMGVVLLRHHEVPPLEDRARELTEVLQSSASTASELERIISDRLALADEVKQRLEHHEKLAALTEEQASAVTQAVDQVLKRERWPTFWLQAAIAVFSLAAGFLLGQFY